VGWFRDLASALAALHAVGLIHRDIKPANVMISEEGVPYLIDFGLAIEGTTPASLRQFLAGTVRYMSPEQTLGGAVALGPRSDIYSLAVTFHEALTGTRVVSGGGQSEALEAVAFVDVPQPSAVAKGIPRSLDPIFTKALAKRPAERYASAQDLAEELDRWLAGRPLIHARESLGIRLARPFRRHPAASSFAILVLLAIVQVIAVPLLQRSFRVRRAMEEAQDLYNRRSVSEALLELDAVAELASSDAEFQALYALLIEVDSRRTNEELLESLAFVMSDLVKEEHARLSAAIRHRLAYARRPHPNLVFQLALIEYLAHDAHAADRILVRYAGLIPTSSFLTELRRLVDLDLLPHSGWPGSARSIRAPRARPAPSWHFGLIACCERRI
jgi:hypothetical protein